MEDQRYSPPQPEFLQRFKRRIFFVWTIFVIGLLIWGIINIRSNTDQLAISSARLHLEKDQAFRYWATRHGGVYVPIDENTPPNPYLANIPERDIFTPAGVPLTLMNPAYMIRQQNEQFAENNGVIGHITSLKPLRPENKPDSWEKSALEAFEKGETEIVAFSDKNGVEYLRLMWPLITTEGCLKCHGDQGYQNGDVRGGISVAVPMESFLEVERNEIVVRSITLGLLWIIGIVGIDRATARAAYRISERDKDIAAFQESEKQFQTMFQHHNAVMLLIEPNSGQIINANRAAAEFYDYPQKDLQEMHLADLNVLPPERIQRERRQAFLEGRNYYIFTHQRADQDERIVEVHSSPIEFGGQQLHFIILHDITQRELAERALIEARTRYRTVANFTHDWEYWENPDGTLNYISPSCERITGYTADEFKSDPKLRSKVVLPEDLKIWENHVEEVKTLQTGPEIQYRIRHKNGSVVWIEHVCQAVTDEDNNFLGFRGSNRDITTRKQGEVLIQENAARAAALAQTATRLNAQLDIDSVLRAVCEAVTNALHVAGASLYLLDKDLESVIYAGHFGEIPYKIQPGARVPEKQFYEFLSQMEELIQIPNIQPLTPLHNNSNSDILPTASSPDDVDHLEGILNLSLESEDRTFTSAELDLLKGLADQAGLAISNALLYEQIQTHANVLEKRNFELARLYQASGSLLYSEIPNLDVLAETIVSTVLSEFEHSNCSLLLIDYNFATPQLERIAAAGPYAKEVTRGNLSLDGAGIVPKAIRSMEIFKVDDVRTDPDYVPNWEAAHSEMAIPLKVGEKVIGVIDIQSSEKNAFTIDDARLMSIFADRAALALENAQLYEQTQQRLQRLSALHNIDMAITGSMELRLTLDLFLEQVLSQLAVDAAAVLLYNSHTQSMEYGSSKGFHTAALQHTHLRLGEGLAGKAALERRLIHLPDISTATSSLEKSPFLKTENFVSYFGVPLIAKGQIKGVLEIFHRILLNPDNEWHSFLQTLATQAAIAIDNTTLFQDLQQTNLELILAYDNTLEGWSRALELRDMETEGHSQRVTELTLKLAQAVGIGAEDLVHVRRGALLHDIGKMGIPDSILHKPGPLTEAEWEVMRCHPTYAHQFLSQIDYLQPALDIPYSHHEKWDGSGYPQGLQGEQIPLAARVFAIIDVYDALRSDRPYRKAWPQEKVLTYIKEQAGSHFDPQVVTAFNQLVTDDANFDQLLEN